MALSGTLKDFGIADILQLIGHQTKTGKLVLKNGPEEVDVLFVEGNVVFASDHARQKESLLGSMLLRAELLNDEKLEEALGVQKRSLKRLGDVLLEAVPQAARRRPARAQLSRRGRSRAGDAPADHGDTLQALL